MDVASVDWNSLEAKFQELNSLLNAPSYGLNANLARQQQKQQVHKAIETLVEMAQAESRRLLVEGKPAEAVEGGLRTLKLKEQFYGAGSLQLVSAYFHLARTNQYLNRFKQAEEFLSLAQWVILKHPNSDVALKAELHQTFGLLYASDEKLDVALKQLAQATYYLTVLNGPNHILTSFGYFDLGNVFAASGNMDNAMAFYEKVKDIWFNHLTLVFELTLRDDDDEEAQKFEHKTPSSLGEENVTDGLKMIRGIVGLQTDRFGLVHPHTGRAELILALFQQWVGDHENAQESFERTLEIHKRVYGAQHMNTMRVRGYMSRFGCAIPSNSAIFESRTDEHIGAIAEVATVDVLRLAREEAEEADRLLQERAEEAARLHYQNEEQYDELGADAGEPGASDLEIPALDEGGGEEEGAEEGVAQDEAAEAEVEPEAE